MMVIHVQHVDLHYPHFNDVNTSPREVVKQKKIDKNVGAVKPISQIKRVYYTPLKRYFLSLPLALSKTQKKIKK